VIKKIEEKKRQNLIGTGF